MSDREADEEALQLIREAVTLGLIVPGRWDDQNELRWSVDQSRLQELEREGRDDKLVDFARFLLSKVEKK